jgi:RNA polymerase sigma-70 factor (ECF subfamily)
MTGSVSDADDLCQEAWLRWSGVDHDEVADPEGFLVTTVTRLAIDRLRSAAHRREAYVGPYLPEPLVCLPGGFSAQPVPDPGEAAELADSLTYAFLVVLDQLDPVERAVLLLHDVFDYRFAEVAAAVDRSEAAVRQIASRARRRIASERRTHPRPTDARVEAVLGGLLGAVSAGDVEAVMGHLAPDVVQLDDGGPHRRAGRRPIVGPHRVARLWVNLAKRSAHLTVSVVEVNARPGLLFTDGDQPSMVLSVELDDDGLVDRVFTQLNPEKLAHLGPRGRS